MCKWSYPKSWKSRKFRIRVLNGELIAHSVSNEMAGRTPKHLRLYALRGQKIDLLVRTTIRVAFFYFILLFALLVHQYDDAEDHHLYTDSYEGPKWCHFA